MNKSNANNPAGSAGKSPDPYLRAFLRQAVAIIAAEKGFTDACQTKLQAIAEQLGLDDDTFKDAVEQLKAPQNQLGLNHYENAFAKSLKIELSKMRSDVINVADEHALVDLAGKKYQIPAIRAHQLIQKFATECGVATIAFDEANQFAEQLVTSAVGHKFELEDSEKQRLYQACEKWGLTAQGVDQTIFRITTENRWQKRRKIISSTVIAVFIAATGIGLYLLAKHVDWKTTFSQPDPIVPNASVQSSPPPRITPTWWNDSIEELATAISHQSDTHRVLISAIKQTPFQSHDQRCRLLVEDYIENRRRNKRLCEFIAQLYLAMPSDSAAKSLLDPISNSIQLASSDQISIGRVRNSVSAAELFASIFFNVNQSRAQSRETRLQILHDFNEGLFSIQHQPIDRQHYQQQAIAWLTLHQWTDVVGHSSQHPDRVSAILADLENRSANEYQSEIDALRILVIQNLLREKPQRLRTIEQSLSKAISHSISSKPWQSLIAGQSAEIKEFVINELSKKTSHKTRGHGSGNEATAIAAKTPTKKQTARINRSKELFQNACESLDSDLAAYEISPGRLQSVEALSERQSIRLLNRLVDTNQLFLAWVELVAKRDSGNAIDAFEQIVKNVDSQPNIELLQIKQPAPSTARRFDDAIKKLTANQAERTRSRITALEKIEALSAQIADVSYSQAKILVGYLGRDAGEREQLAIERCLPAIIRWPTLLLAMADAIQTKMISANQTTVRQTLDEIAQLDTAEMTSDQIQRMLLKQSHQRLSQSAKANAALWNSFRRALEFRLCQRLSICSKDLDIETDHSGQFDFRSDFLSWIVSNENYNSLLPNQIEQTASGYKDAAGLAQLNRLWWQKYFEAESEAFELLYPESAMTSNLNLWITIEFAAYQKLKQIHSIHLVE